MTFAETLKTMRKKAGMSQEQLAEKLHVSRQAVTKWETQAGIPDIENIIGISAVFGVSLDELLSNEKGRWRKSDYVYESVTEYDIDERKHYDIKLGSAKKVIFTGTEKEKIRIRLTSNTLATLSNDFKVKIDDTKRRIDIDAVRKNGMTEARAKEEVLIFVDLPNSYIGKIEVTVHAETIEIRSLECENIELDAKVKNLILDGVVGTVEVNCNLDMNVVCYSLEGAVELNQISATSRIHVPEGTVFSALTKGIATSISYEKDGKSTEPFCTSDAENVIELNGIKSELVIFT